MEINDVIRYDDGVVRGIVLEKRKKGGGGMVYICMCSGKNLPGKTW